MGGAGGFTCMSETQTETIENFMVTHDSYLVAINNHNILSDQMKSLASDLQREGLMDNFNPLESMRATLETMSLTGLR